MFDIQDREESEDVLDEEDEEDGEEEESLSSELDDVLLAKLLVVVELNEQAEADVSKLVDEPESTAIKKNIYSLVITDNFVKI